MSWALLVKRAELVAVAAVEVQAGPEFRQSVRFDPGRLQLVNTDTGEVREWGSGLDALMEVYDGNAGLLGRIARALGPDVERRWEDGDEGLDLAAEVQQLRTRLAAAEETAARYRGRVIVGGALADPSKDDPLTAAMRAGRTGDTFELVDLDDECDHCGSGIRRGGDYPRSTDGRVFCCYECREMAGAEPAGDGADH